MRSFGIMQGRLTPSQGRGIQFFPFDEWENEFEVGKKIGINEIEWIFDYGGYENNPLWTSDGIRRIKKLIERTGVSVRSVCFDYFMRRPFYKAENSVKSVIRRENLEFVKRVIDGMVGIDAALLEIPMVDDSSMKTDDEKEQAIEFLREVLRMAEGTDIFIGCETDMPVGKFRDFLDYAGDKRIKANYDSGNSSGLGYDHTDEIHSLSDYIANVHIKDRLLHGSTVKLGTGSADFDKVFSSLRDIGYRGSVILQAARGADGKEADTIAEQLDFVKRYCEKYDLE